MISLPSSLPTVTTLTLTTTTITPAPPPNQGAILLVCHGSSHLEQPQCDTGIVIQLGQTVLEAWTCGEKPNTEKVLPINTCSFQMSSYKWRGSKQPPLSQRTTPGPRVFKSQALRLLVTWTPGLGHVRVELLSGLGRESRQGWTYPVMAWLQQTIHLTLRHAGKLPASSHWAVPRIYELLQSMMWVWVWARHYHQEKVDNFPLPPLSFSYCWLYCSDTSCDLIPSAAKGVGEGNGTPLQYSCLENPMDGGAWYPVVHGVAKSRTWLSDFTFTFHFHALEKEMATHSSVLAWRIPGTGEPGWAAVYGVTQSRTRLKRLSSSSSSSC